MRKKKNGGKCESIFQAGKTHYIRTQIIKYFSLAAGGYGDVHFKKVPIGCSAFQGNSTGGGDVFQGYSIGDGDEFQGHSIGSGDAFQGHLIGSGDAFQGHSIGGGGDAFQGHSIVSNDAFQGCFDTRFRLSWLL